MSINIFYVFKTLHIPSAEDLLLIGLIKIKLEYFPSHVWRRTRQMSIIFMFSFGNWIFFRIELPAMRSATLAHVVYPPWSEGNRDLDAVWSLTWCVSQESDPGCPCARQALYHVTTSTPNNSARRHLLLYSCGGWPCFRVNNSTCILLYVNVIFNYYIHINKILLPTPLSK